MPEAYLFFLSPSLLNSLESRPIEEVLFLRDEMANLAWAVERLIESPAEQSLNRFEVYLEQQRRLDQAASPPMDTNLETLRYQLMTEFTKYWVPLAPVQTEKGQRLKRDAVINTDNLYEPVHALGRILESGQVLSVFKEEVPCEGIYVTRRYQTTRWIDGSSHL